MPSSCPSSASCDVHREPELGDLARRVLLDELARRPLGDDLRLVHDDEPVAQLLRLVHVVGRQDERHAALLEPVQPLPEQVPGLRVEPGRRLVEEQDRRLVDERACDRQAPLHPARQRLDLVVRTFGELRELEELVGPARGLGSLEAEVPAVDHEVVADGDLGVERVLLGHDAEAAADPRTVGLGVEVEDAERPVGHRRDARDHAHRAGLPGAVGPEEAEALALGDVEVDRVDRGERAEALGQATRVDERGGGRLGAGRVGHGRPMVPAAPGPVMSTIRDRTVRCAAPCPRGA